MFQGVELGSRANFIRATVSSIGEGVLVADKNGRIIYMNNAAEELTGMLFEEAAGKPAGEVFPLKNAYSGNSLPDPVRTTLLMGVQTGLQNNTVLCTKDGKTIFVSANCSPIISENGQTDGVAVVFRDIDRIKHMEENLRSERNHLKSVLEALPTGIIRFGGDGRIRWVNAQLLKLFQIEAEDIIGLKIGDATHCVNRPEEGCGTGEKCELCEIRTNVHRVFADGIPRKDVIVERSFITAGMLNEMWLRVNFIPLESGENTQVLAAIEDITEQRRFEEALMKRRDEAESANRMKSEFLANMSHEIRTPLNGMIGMLDLLLGTDADEEQGEYIRMAKYSAESLLSVINDILDFSRLEAGRVAISDEPFNLKAMLADVAKIQSVLAKNKGLRLEHSVDAALPEIVSGDMVRLRQVLNNLIGNAMKFTERGVIRMEAYLTAQTDDSLTVGFSVTDTGIGISQEKMELLFQRFSQVDGSATRRFSGTGLGLAICKQLVELMGGRITAESTAGMGSTFSFTIALRRVSAEIEVADNLFTHAYAIVTDRAQLAEPSGGEAAQPVVFMGENGEALTFGGNTDPPPTPAVLSNEELFERARELKIRLTRLREDVSAGHVRRLEDDAHTVREAAVQAGADTIGDLAFKAEMAARKSRWDAIAELSVKMLIEYTANFDHE
ncbi:MAG: ATP-binding protein [Oscillospiraceae bacterium]